MNEQNLSSFIGVIRMDRLFVGSKSEGLYPVLHAENGKQFRLHHKGDISMNEKMLSSYDGKTVQITGNVDNLRGHWRIVLAPESVPLVVEASPLDELLAPTAAAVALSGQDLHADSVPPPTKTDTFSPPKDNLPEGPDHKTNHTEE
ncbi:MAG: hypothetical protein D4R94_04565 [Chitinophagaceae bacterium]|nr:MAG: hypothetical protein D4R94_04565 [Chitinophagaceae bacterium]